MTAREWVRRSFASMSARSQRKSAVDEATWWLDQWADYGRGDDLRKALHALGVEQ